MVVRWWCHLGSEDIGVREIVGEGLVLLPDGKGFLEALWGFFWEIWEGSEVCDV